MFVFGGVGLFCVLVWFELGLFQFSCGLLHWCFAFKFVCLMNLGLLIVACVFKFYTFVLNWLCFVGWWAVSARGWFTYVICLVCLVCFYCVLNCWFSCCFGRLCILICVWRLYFLVNSSSVFCVLRICYVDLFGLFILCGLFCGFVSYGCCDSWLDLLCGWVDLGVLFDCYL